MVSESNAEDTAILKVDPDTTLTFELHRTSSDSASEASKCFMTLHHLGSTTDSLAFKVKTTQPRRYLVRPNQGLIEPNQSETISILLVEKDKQSLLQSYDRLGPSALDHSKDKFLVQSCTVSKEFSSSFSTAGSKEVGDALTTMWSQGAGSSNATSPLLNKKLHVKHVVVVGIDSKHREETSTVPDLNAERVTLSAVSSNDQQSLIEEVNTLHRKYDELVAFSVNLTNERDILNNTLEQTKRDLNREMAIRASLEVASSNKKASPTKIGGWTTLQILVLAFACFFMGLKAGLYSENIILP